MADKAVSILLVGIGGYGHFYLDAMLNGDKKERFTIAGAVDVRPEQSEFYTRLQEIWVPVYPTIKQFYAKHSADLAIICTPIQYHLPYTEYALLQGSHVLCEKPAAATIQEVRAMKEARDRTGRFVAIGFNWSYYKQIHKLKQDIQSGLFGKPKRLKTVVLWQRSKEYFGRAAWSGRRKSDRGEWILDSVAHNATSHYLHNMFYVLGSHADTSARPARVVSELYRANEIENFDTCAIRAYTGEQVELLYFATHAVTYQSGPCFSYEFEHATLHYEMGKNNNQINAYFHDGREMVYEIGDDRDINKLWHCIRAARTGDYSILPCGIEAAESQVLCINGAHESSPEVLSFPHELISYEEQSKTVWVKGLDDLLIECYKQNKLPSEMGVEWSVLGKTIDLERYDRYEG